MTCDEPIPGQLTIDDWRYEGRADLVRWCPDCYCTTIPSNFETCLWCSAELAPPGWRPSR